MTQGMAQHWAERFQEFNQAQTAAPARPVAANSPAAQGFSLADWMAQHGPRPGGASATPDAYSQILQDAAKMRRWNPQGLEGTSSAAPPLEAPGGVKGFFGSVIGGIDKVTFGGFTKALDVIDTPRAAIVSTIQEVGDVFQGEGWSWSDWGQQTKDNIGFAEVLDDWGVENVWVRRIGGFAGDVLLDPTTYIAPGITAGSRGQAVTSRIMNLASRQGDDVAGLAAKAFLQDAGATVLRRGGSALSPTQVRQIQALDLLDRGLREGADAAAAAAVNNIGETTLRTIAAGSDRAGLAVGRQLGAAAPDLLRGGIRMQLPGTGRIAQRLSRGRVSEAKTFAVLGGDLGQQIAKYTPRGLYQQARGVATGTQRFSGVARLFGGDYQSFREMIRNGDPGDVYNAFLSRESANAGRAVSHAWLVDQQTILGELVQKVTKDKTQYIMPALGGDATAIAALGDDAWDAVQTWRTQWRDSVNALAGGNPDNPLLRDLSNWAPHKWSDDFTAWIRQRADSGDKTARKLLDDSTAPESLGDVTRSLDPEAPVAKIAPGREFMGEKIYAYGDEANPDKARQFMTPRQQADEIIKSKFELTGSEAFDTIFSQDFVESTVSNLVWTAQQLGLAHTINDLVGKKIAVDMGAKWALESAAQRSKYARYTAALDRLRRRVDPEVERRMTAAREALDAAETRRAEVIQTATTETRAQVARAKRRADAVHTLVQRATDYHHQAVDSAQGVLDELARDGGARLDELDKLAARAQTASAKIRKRVTSTQAKISKLRSERQRLLERAYEASGTERRRAGAEVAESGRRIAQIERQLDELYRQRDIWSGVAEGRLDPKRLAGAADRAAKLDEAIPVLEERLENLQYANFMDPKARAELVAKTERELAAAQSTRAAIRDEIAVYQTLMSDLELDWTEWYRTQMDNAFTGDAMIQLFGEGVTPAQARQILQNPAAARSQLATQLGLDPAMSADEQILAMLRTIDDGPIEDLQRQLEHFKKYANAPEHVNGQLVNWRDPEGGWTYGHNIDPKGRRPRNGMENFYGRTFSSRVHDPEVPGHLVTPNTRRDPLRAQIRSTNPQVYYGNIDAVNFDAMEAYLNEAKGVAATWGKEWRDIHSRVRNGETLRQAVMDVFPGQDPQAVVKELLGETGRVSPTARQNMARAARRRSIDNGFDSMAWFDDVTGEWVVTPHDRRAVDGFMSELPETVAENYVRTSEKRALKMAETAEAKDAVRRQLTVDLEELMGRDRDLWSRNIRLEKARKDLEERLRDASERGDEVVAEMTQDSLRRLERAQAYQIAAEEHLDNVLKMHDEVARGAAEPLDLEIEQLKGEVAKAEAAYEASLAQRAALLGTPEYQKNISEIQKMTDKLKKNIDEETWKAAIDEGMRQVGGDMAVMMPEKVAEGLEAVSRMSYKETLKHFDSFMGWWRAGATTSPGFHFRNYAGGIMNNLAAGINPARYGQWHQMQDIWNKIQHGGGKTRRALDAIPGVNATGVGELDLEATYRRTIEAAQAQGINQEVIDAYVAVRRSGLAEGGQFDALAVQNLGEPGKQSKWAMKGANPLSSQFALYRYSRNRGGAVEERLRGALAMDVMLKGGTIQEAMHTVYKFHFDYDDLSTFERTWMRRFVNPFYTWMRKNLALQVELLAENPVAFQRYIALQRNLEHGTEEEALVPHYFNKLTAIRLPWKVGEFGSQLYLNPSTPFSNLTDVLDPRGLINGTPPPIKIPLQQWIAGKNLFTEAPYGPAEFTDVPAGWAAIPGFLPALETLGATRNASGKWVMPTSWFDTVSGAVPVLSQMARMPAVGTDSRSPERKATSFVSWLTGVGTTVNSPDLMSNELYRIAYGWKDAADQARELGDEEMAKHYYEQYEKYRQDAAELRGYYNGDEDAERPEWLGQSEPVAVPRQRGIVPDRGRTSEFRADTLAGVPINTETVSLPGGIQEDDIQVDWNPASRTVTFRWPGGSKTVGNIDAEDDFLWDFAPTPFGADLIVNTR